MEKTIFFFRRHKDRDPQNFALHYINNHAPLGARLTRCLEGYTVNIVNGKNGLDAVTEHWVPAALDLLTPTKAYATPEDFEEVWNDDRTLFDGFDLYVVVEETYPVAGEPLATSPGEATPETKQIWTYPDTAAAPPPPVNARRVVDNRVGYKLVHEGDGWKSIPPDLQLIRMVWGGAEDRTCTDAQVITVREYCFIAPPRWDDGVGRAEK